MTRNCKQPKLLVRGIKRDLTIDLAYQNSDKTGFCLNLESSGRMPLSSKIKIGINESTTGICFAVSHKITF
jgi:hypothetical protein